jgi:hypothetical protein
MQGIVDSLERPWLLPSQSRQDSVRILGNSHLASCINELRTFKWPTNPLEIAQKLLYLADVVGTLDAATEKPDTPPIVFKPQSRPVWLPKDLTDYKDVVQGLVRYVNNRITKLLPGLDTVQQLDSSSLDPGLMTTVGTYLYQPDATRQIPGHSVPLKDIVDLNGDSDQEPITELEVRHFRNVNYSLVSNVEAMLLSDNTPFEPVHILLYGARGCISSKQVHTLSTALLGVGNNTSLQDTAHCAVADVTTLTASTCSDDFGDNGCLGDDHVEFDKWEKNILHWTQIVRSSGQDQWKDVLPLFYLDHPHSFTTADSTSTETARYDPRSVRKYITAEKILGTRGDALKSVVVVDHIKKSHTTSSALDRQKCQELIRSIIIGQNVQSETFPDGAWTEVLVEYRTDEQRADFFSNNSHLLPSQTGLAEFPDNFLIDNLATMVCQIFAAFFVDMLGDEFSISQPVYAVSQTNVSPVDPTERLAEDDQKKKRSERGTSGVHCSPHGSLQTQFLGRKQNFKLVKVNPEIFQGLPWWETESVLDQMYSELRLLTLDPVRGFRLVVYFADADRLYIPKDPNAKLGKPASVFNKDSIRTKSTGMLSAKEDTCQHGSVCKILVPMLLGKNLKHAPSFPKIVVLTSVAPQLWSTQTKADVPRSLRAYFVDLPHSVEREEILFAALQTVFQIHSDRTSSVAKHTASTRQVKAPLLRKFSRTMSLALEPHWNVVKAYLQRQHLPDNSVNTVQSDEPFEAWWTDFMLGKDSYLTHGRPLIPFRSSNDNAQRRRSQRAIASLKSDLQNTLHSLSHRSVHWATNDLDVVKTTIQTLRLRTEILDTLVSHPAERGSSCREFAMHPYFLNPPVHVRNQWSNLLVQLKLALVEIPAITGPRRSVPALWAILAHHTSLSTQTDAATIFRNFGATVVSTLNRSVDIGKEYHQQLAFLTNVWQGRSENSTCVFEEHEPNAQFESYSNEDIYVSSFAGPMKFELRDLLLRLGSNLSSESTVKPFWNNVQVPGLSSEPDSESYPANSSLLTMEHNKRLLSAVLSAVDNVVVDTNTDTGGSRTQRGDVYSLAQNLRDAMTLRPNWLGFSHAGLSSVFEQGAENFLLRNFVATSDPGTVPVTVSSCAHINPGTDGNADEIALGIMNCVKAQLMETYDSRSDILKMDIQPNPQSLLNLQKIVTLVDYILSIDWCVAGEYGKGLSVDGWESTWHDLKIVRQATLEISNHKMSEQCEKHLIAEQHRMFDTSNKFLLFALAESVATELLNGVPDLNPGEYTDALMFYAGLR